MRWEEVGGGVGWGGCGWVLAWVGAVWAGFDLDKLSPIEHAQTCFIPCLFATGADDDFIDPVCTRRRADRRRRRRAPPPTPPPPPLLHRGTWP